MSDKGIFRFKRDMISYNCIVHTLDWGTCYTVDMICNMLSLFCWKKVNKRCNSKNKMSMPIVLISKKGHIELNIYSFEGFLIDTEFALRTMTLLVH